MTANSKSQLQTGTTVQTAGIALGTVVMTLDGEIPVEHLSVGDRIITRDSGMAVLKSIHTQEITTRPYRISADRLGPGRPDVDTLVTADQPILVRGLLAKALFASDSAMVPVSRLADGEYIAKCEEQTLRVYELEFDTPHVIYANGLELASACHAVAVAA
jgi:hypothetical protein